MPDRIVYVMGRLLACLVFAIAGGGSVLASGSLVVAPHVDPPGTPRFHDHFFAAYRYSIYLLRLALPLSSGPRFDVAAPTPELAGTLVLALGVAIVARLPRPTRRPIAALALPRVPRPQWYPALALGPPRTPTLLASATQTT